LDFILLLNPGFNKKTWGNNISRDFTASWAV
jgi:hypothetical protein